MSRCRHPDCSYEHGLIDGLCSWHLTEQLDIVFALTTMRNDLPWWARLRRRYLTTTIKEVMSYVP